MPYEPGDRGSAVAVGCEIGGALGGYSVDAWLVNQMDFLLKSYRP
jgi:hypothetical protein